MRPIAANSIQKTMAITSFTNRGGLHRIAEGIKKNNGEHFGGEILALFGRKFSIKYF